MKHCLALFASGLLLLATVHGQPNDAVSASGTDTPTPRTKSRVVILEDPTLVNNYHVNEARLGQNFNRAFLTFTRKNSLKDAWRSFVSPSDVVAIHISTAGGQVLSTHHGLVQAVVDGLREAGVPSANIIVWDKFGDEMRTAGYPPNSGVPYQCSAVVPGAGFDGQKVYFNDVAGQLIWGDHDFRGRADLTSKLTPLTELSGSSSPSDITVSGTKPSEPPQVSNRSYYNNIVSRRATKIINMPVMSSDERIGVFGCISSLALACIDNNRRFLNGSDATAEALPEILTNDVLKGKVVLHIMDGSLAQYAGGPYFVPYYCNQPGLLYISQDPVAIDSIVLDHFTGWRKIRRIDPIGDEATHIKQAAMQGLGTTDKNQMEIINLR